MSLRQRFILALLLPASTTVLVAAAMARAETIRDHVAELQVTHHRQTLGPVTVSIGVASFPAHAGSPNELLATADRALYRAKHEGRNRVCVAELRERADTDRG